MATSETPVERRRFERLRIAVKVELGWRRRNSIGYSGDLSMGGIFVEVQDPPAVGEKVRVEFHASGGAAPGTVIAEGTAVRRVTPEQATGAGLLPGVGVEFDRIAFGKETLASLLLARQAKELPPDKKPKERAPRLASDLPVLWGIDETDAPGRLVNLSASGAFVVLTEEPAPPNSRIKVSLTVPVGATVRSVNAIARVVRVLDVGGGQTGMGLAFERATEDIGVLRRFVQERLREQDDFDLAALSGPASAREPATATVDRTEERRWRRYLLVVGIGVLGGLLVTLLAFAAIAYLLP